MAQESEPEWHELYRSLRKDRITALKEALSEEKSRKDKRVKELNGERESLRHNHDSSVEHLEEVREVFRKEIDFFDRYKSSMGLPFLIMPDDKFQEMREVRDKIRKIFEEDKKLDAEYDSVVESILRTARKIIIKKAEKTADRMAARFPNLQGAMRTAGMIEEEISFQRVKANAHRRAVESLVRNLERRIGEEEREYSRRDRAIGRDEKELLENYGDLKKQLLKDAAKDNMRVLKETCESFGKRELSETERYALEQILNLKSGKGIDYEGIELIGVSAIRSSLEALANSSIISKNKAVALLFYLPEEKADIREEGKDKGREEVDRAPSPYKNGNNRARYPIQRAEPPSEAPAISRNEVRVLISRRALERARKDDSIRQRWDRFTSEIEMIARNHEERPREKMGDFSVSPRGYGGSAAPRIAWTFDGATNTLRVYDLLYHISSQKYVDDWNHKAKFGEITRETYERGGFEEFKGLQA